MQRRFESDPLFKATLLLLQERIPKAAALYAHPAELSTIRAVGERSRRRRCASSTSPDTPVAGSAAAVERPLPRDGDQRGRRLHAAGRTSPSPAGAKTPRATTGARSATSATSASGEFWSTAHQPTLQRAGALRSDLHARRGPSSAGATRTSKRILEIVVSPEDDIELRRLRITNRSRTRRTIDVTSYAEVALAPPAADALHPAFSNLFVQTEIVRAAAGDPVHAAAALARRADALDVPPDGGARRRLVRRLLRDRPHGVHRARPHGRRAASDAGAGTAVGHARARCSIRSSRSGSRITLDPQQTATIDMRPASRTRATRRWPRRQVPGSPPRRPRVRPRLDAQRGDAAADQRHRVRCAALRAARQLRHLFANASLRAEAAVLLRNRRGQSGLWSYAISGDLPIVLLQIGDAENIDLVRQLVQAHAYWRLKGLAVDLVIWNEDRGGYRQVLQDQIMGLIAAGIEAHVMDRPGGIFVRPRRADLGRGPHPAAVGGARHHHRSPGQPRRAGHAGAAAPDVARSAARADARITGPRRPRRRAARARLILANGLGGFTPDGREYVITLAPRRDDAGAVGRTCSRTRTSARVISESGLALHVERERARVPPDALAQRPRHRCERRGVLPARRGDGAVLVADAAARAAAPALRHAPRLRLQRLRARRGRHRVRARRSTSRIDAPVKFSVLKVRNASGRPRRLSATGYVEWVLGDLRPKTTMHVVTEIDAQDRRAARAQCLQHRVSRPRRVLRRRRRRAHA